MTRPIRFSCRAAALTLAAMAAGAGCRSLQLQPAATDAIKPVIAVSSFENRSSFAGQWQLGTGMADLLVSELITSGHFTVVERGQLDRVMSELQLQQNQHFRAEGRAGSGRLKNARYLIRGVINDFDQVGGGSFWFSIKNLLMGGRGYAARVAMTLTIVDIESGVIIDSVQADGLARAREAYAEGTYRNVRFGGDVFFKTPLGIATSRAIQRGLQAIITHMPCEYWRAMIAEVHRDGRVVINGGTDRDLRTGMRFEVREPGRPVTDPATGDTLAVLPGLVVGHVRVTEVLDHIAFGEAIMAGSFQRGQFLVPLR